MIEASPRRLLVYKLVVDLGGFNAAAIELGIAQPSVGAHVDALEQQAGQMLLLRRRGTRPQLTEAGRLVYEMASEVVRLSEETALRLANLKARQNSEIVIAVHRDLANSFLPRHLTAFARKNPRSRIVTRIGTLEDVTALVERGSVELGVTLGNEAIRGLSSEVIGHEPLLLVAGKSHPLARARAVGSADLSQQLFVTGLRQSRYFRMVDRALLAIGVSDYKVSLELQESMSVREAVRHGQYIAALPRCTVTGDVAAGHLVVLDVARKLAPMQIRCVYRAEPRAAVRRLIRQLRT